MNQASIIGFPVVDNRQLLELIQILNSFIQSSSIGMYFRPFNLYDIHGTIIGLEKTDNQIDSFNLNLFDQLGIMKQMEFEKAIKLIEEYLPINIRFGGFSPSFNSFLSWGEYPYSSSFQLFSRGPDATIIGWPHSNGDFSDNLFLRMRTALEKRCNIRHKYAKELDNGFFINLGKFSGGGLDNAHLSKNKKIERNELVKTIRDYLFLNPIDITLDSKNIKIVQYKKLAQGQINIIGEHILTETSLSNEIISKLY